MFRKKNIKSDCLAHFIRAHVLGLLIFFIIIIENEENDMPSTPNYFKK